MPEYRFSYIALVIRFQIVIKNTEISYCHSGVGKGKMIAISFVFADKSFKRFFNYAYVNPYNFPFEE